MKSTLNIRTIANPRRTTLAHLEDAEGMTTTAVAGQGSVESDQLPSSTANPRRTVLMDDPKN